MNSSDHLFRPFVDDHRRVLAQLDGLERSILTPPRASLDAACERELGGAVTMLARQFATHMRAEEDVLFPALAEALPEARSGIRPLKLEHHDLRRMLVRLAALLSVERAEHDESTAARDEQITVQLRDLIDLLRIHIHKEEAAVFAVAARVLTPEEGRTLAARIAAHLHKDPHQDDPPRGSARPKGTWS